MDCRLFDGQVVRPPESFRDAAREYIPVRVTNINDVDLNLFPFDYDLTMAIVLSNADGTVYHRYGGRDRISPMHMDTLVDLLRAGLATHREYQKNPNPPEPKPPRRLAQLIRDRLQGQIKATFGCYHCHYAREAVQLLALEAGQWTPDQFWIWPSTEQVGLVMNQRRQNTVVRVLAGSPAALGGFRPGDVLARLDGNRVVTKYDFQWVLHRSADNAIALPYTAKRDGQPRAGVLRLSPGWKTGDPANYLWRVRNVFTEHMIKFLPTPGLIGRQLSAEELDSLKLAPDRFALEVTQLNHGTYLAGVRLGDVILGAGGRSDFSSMRDFYHWCEILRRTGRDIRIELERQGTVLKLMVSLKYLNYSRVEKAPRVTLGFIVQELPGNGGLRVGHVTDNSSAEKTGLRIGDRIVSVEGSRVADSETLTDILNGKAPGDMLAIEVRRDGKPLQFGFVLPGEEVRTSNLARLSATPVEKGQELTCIVTINSPTGWHVYSVHRRGFGLPTRLDFRGQGFELVGNVQEPAPRRVADPGTEVMWVLDGRVELKQTIRVTDPARFQLLLRVYAQVCDESSCHEFLATIVNDGLSEGFSEFHGRFD